MLPVAAQAQVGQAQPGQVQPGQVQPGGIQQQPTRPPAANPNAAITTRQAQDRGESQQTNEQLEQLVTAKLLIANKGVIELGKMATEKANDEQVKEFAQTLVKAYESLCRDIEKLQTSKGYSKNGDHAKGDKPSQTAQNQPRQPGQPNPPGVRPTIGDQQASSRNSQEIVAKLETIAKKSSKKQLEMAKAMLQKHEGKDFDMAFVGLQIAAHMQAVADLNALQGVGSKEMQEVVNQAETATNKHLQRAKDLADQLSSK